MTKYKSDRDYSKTSSLLKEHSGGFILGGGVLNLVHLTVSKVNARQMDYLLEQIDLLLKTSVSLLVFWAETQQVDVAAANSKHRLCVVR